MTTRAASFSCAASTVVIVKNESVWLVNGAGCDYHFSVYSTPSSILTDDSAGWILVAVPDITEQGILYQLFPLLMCVKINTQHLKELDFGIQKWGPQVALSITVNTLFCNKSKRWSCLGLCLWPSWLLRNKYANWPLLQMRLWGGLPPTEREVSPVQNFVKRQRSQDSWRDSSGPVVI